MCNTKNWYVIHTKPRNEKKVFEQIVNKEIEAFLPLIQTVRYWSDRKKKLMVPLFPSYVFVNTNENERIRAISNTYGAMRYVIYQKRPAIVSDKEILNIKLSLQLPDKIKIEEKKISEGDLVEITGGIFRGLTGYIKEIRGHYKLIVNIMELNSTFSVQLSSSEVRLLKPFKYTNLY
ncbi:MAG: UpxY family transcription antiterminator [Ignavibacteria bacterium]